MFVPPPPTPDPTPGPPTEEASRQHHEPAAHVVLDLLELGVPRGRVFHRLLEMGCDAEAAARVVSHISRGRSDAHPSARDEEAYRRALKQLGERNMVIGGLVFLVGAAITLFTLWPASAASRGSYGIACGAVAVGALRFFRGMSQVGAAKQGR
jgi:hypothetical protein